MPRILWPTTRLHLGSATVEAIAPEIISASRATDIPAFYAPWFFRRLDAGYVKRINPFNRRAQYISFERTRAVVFWSKNPAPLLPLLPRLEARGIAFYVQFTLNNYEAEGLEPRVPPLRDRIETFRALSRLVGPERVIWRFDPLLITDALPPERLLEKVASVGEAVRNDTTTLIFSFADIVNYPKVRNTLLRNGVNAREFTVAEMRRTAAEIAGLCAGWGLSARTCAEGLDLSEYGVRPSSCIDGELIRRLTHDDPTIRQRFGLTPQRQATLLPDGPSSSDERSMKDPGQRKACGCAPSKDIGQYDTCPHGCVYCYARTSEAAVAANLARFSERGEGLTAE